MSKVICKDCKTTYNSGTVSECPVCKLNRIHNYGDDMTLEEISTKMNITKERVRQIEQSALLKLKNPLLRKHLQSLQS
jgi:DNA-directed RNA polymerase sigma subunit (sigma70/sigma32)